MKRILSAFVLLLVTLACIFAYRALYVTPIVMYHSIALPQNDREYANSVSPQSFRRQMDFLKRQGYRVLSLDEYVAGRREGNNFCCQSVVLTFDDGLENNYAQAMDVLNNYGFPATFFVVPGLAGSSGYMTNEQIKDASRRNITIGSHTQNHAYLPGVSREEQRREIVDSKKTLEVLVGKPVDYLCYPIGGFSEEIKKIAREAGYQAAFATNRGYDRLNRDLFEQKRIRFKESDSDIVLRTKLSGFYNLIRKSKSPY